MLYLNVGHTGLEQKAHPRWIVHNRIRAVYFIHDLIPLTHPQFCRPGETDKHARRMTNALASGTGVIANSRVTLAELAQFAASRKISMPSSAVAWIAGLRGRSELGAKELGCPYFLTVGTVEGRKNHLLLLRVWERLSRSLGKAAPLLVIIGERGWQADETLRWLDQLGDLNGHVREIGGCNDEELARWMKGARALLMPSFVEGFGLPVVEALDAGTPVIASDLPVYREIAQDIPEYLDPNDVGAWERMVTAFMNDDLRRRRQIDRASSYVAPSWQEHFRSVDGWLATL
jgi:glycosyltransferase involved in cell wall biosynthesis